MTMHKSLKSRSMMAGQRSVLSRWERLESLTLAGRWKQGDSVLGLPKVRTKFKVRRKVTAAVAPVPGAAAPAAGAAAAPVAGKAPAGKAPAGKAPAGKAPAAAAKAAAPAAAGKAAAAPAAKPAKK